MNVTNTEESQMVLESPDGTWWGASDWTEDDTTILVQNYISITNSKIYLVDVETQKKQLILGKEEEPSANSALAFDKDDKGVFYITDKFSQFSQLTYHNLESGEDLIISSEIPWDVDGFAMSEDGKRAAFVVNENGYSLSLIHI